MSIGIPFILGGALAFVRNPDVILIALSIPIIPSRCGRIQLMRAHPARAVPRRVDGATPSTRDAANRDRSASKPSPARLFTTSVGRSSSSRPTPEEFTSNYLIRHYPNLPPAAPRSNHCLGSMTPSADTATPRIFIVHAKRRAHGVQLATHQPYPLHVVGSDARGTCTAQVT